MISAVDIILSVIVIIVAGVAVAFGYLARTLLVGTVQYQTNTTFDTYESAISWATVLTLIGVIINIIIVIMLFLYSGRSDRYGSSRGVRWLVVIGAVVYFLAALIFAYIAWQINASNTQQSTEIDAVYRDVVIAAVLTAVATLLMIVLYFSVRRDARPYYPSEYPTFAYPTDPAAYQQIRAARALRQTDNPARVTTVTQVQPETVSSTITQPQLNLKVQETKQIPVPNVRTRLEAGLLQSDPLLGEVNNTGSLQALGQQVDSLLI